MLMYCCYTVGTAAVVVVLLFLCYCYRSVAVCCFALCCFPFLLCLNFDFMSVMNERPPDTPQDTCHASVVRIKILPR